jgi:dihydrofolate reductase
VIDGDIAQQVAGLSGTIAVLGSGALVRTLIEHDLVDEYFLVVFPILMGSGKRLFGSAAEPRKLSLVDSKVTGTGGVMLTYRPAR